ncbi:MULTISPECIES: methyltransferase domain-containing protein [Bradyrhizobium]|uniref:methyltransferase domain-containing protein n=1 Tax=Bradyrhizobium TaxID=374 RepID=UPI0015600DCA|nr:MULTISPECIES: methyltransferase domain-containing protein [Bradyrhizobium]
MAETIRAWQPDVVHTLGLDSASYLMDMARAAQPDIVEIGRWVVQVRGGPDLALHQHDPDHRRRIESVFAHCDHLIADNSINYQDAIKLGLEPHKIDSPGLGIVSGPGGLDVAAMRATWSLLPSQRPRTILWPKTYETISSKALPVFEALRLAWDRIAPVKIEMLWLVQSDVKTWFDKSMPDHIKASCNIHGRLDREEVLSMLPNARVMLAPSLTDGIPNSMMEAMALGAFPIVSPLDTITPVVKNEENVLFARNLYPEEITEAIVRAMQDDALVDAAAERNVTLVEKLADRTRIRSKVIAYYTELAAMQRPAAGLTVASLEVGPPPNTSAEKVLCGMCGRVEMDPTDQVVDIGVLIKRWSDHGVVFSPETINEYNTKKIGPIRLFECPSCGFGQFRPIVVGNADFYAAIGRVDYYTGSKWEFERSIELIQMRSAGSVIDVGCGSGFFLDHLRKAMPSVGAMGIEINAAAAAAARSRGHRVEILDWVNEDFSIADLPKADVVVCHQVLEHIKNPLRLLQAIRFMLTENGIAIISTPNATGLVAAYPDALTEQPPHHVTKWSDRVFRAALPRVGLSPTAIEHEPLPNYLFGGYLPVVWKANGWPAQFGQAAARVANLPDGGVDWFTKVLQSSGTRYVHGVGGHTVLVTARAVG